MVPYARRRRLKARYNRIARRIVLRNAERGRDQVSEETLGRLREHYAADTLQLAALLGRSPPWQVPVRQAEALASRSGPESGAAGE